MKQNYGRDLDLNLLRVFVVVADEGSVTAAAGRLYLTQPAVSAALKRLATAVGAKLFVRQGRGLALTDRGRRLLAEARPHLEGLVDAALAAPPRFDAKTSTRTFRLGLADSAVIWLLPPLLRVLRKEAPGITLIVLPVQFRNIGASFVDGVVDVAVTVADDLPGGVRRQRLFTGGFVCLYDPRHAQIPRRPKKLTLDRYLAHDHVAVSYNGDVRGVVEDVVGVVRDVRVSVSSFHVVGSIVEGSPLLATVPAVVARDLQRLHPKLQTTALPFALAGAYIELLWPAVADDDEAAAFVRGHIAAIAARASH